MIPKDPKYKLHKSEEMGNVPEYPSEIHGGRVHWIYRCIKFL